MEYFLYGFWVFIGIIAGTTVNLLSQWVVKKRNEKQKVKNLKFEFELNIKKFDGWLKELNKYRNAVNGDFVENYFGYFDLSQIVSVTANDMFQSGLLYNYLSHEEIGKLQVIYTEISPYGEKFLSDQINNQKISFNKANAIKEINYWEERFKEHKSTFDNLLKDKKLFN